MSKKSGISRNKPKMYAWLLETFGDGKQAPCAFCGQLLTIGTITVDHYPKPKCLGGTLRKGNIRPACRECNNSHGGQLSQDQDLMRRAAQRREQKRAAHEAKIEGRNSGLQPFTHTIAELVQ